MAVLKADLHEGMNNNSSEKWPIQRFTRFAPRLYSALLILSSPKSCHIERTIDAVY